MRVWHGMLAIFLAAIVIKITENPAGKVAVVVFTTGLGLIILGATGLLWLFQTLGEIGAANGGGQRLAAVGASAVVLFLATASMTGVLLIGMSFLKAILQ